MGNYRMRLSVEEQQLIQNHRQLKQPQKNKLIIPDLHQPYEHPRALEFCKKVYKEFNCDSVIFIGDVIDNSQTTRWETNPNADSAKLELEKSIDKLRPWYKAFPNSIVLEGNHEARIMKKLHRGGVSDRWLRNISEVLEVPKWNFMLEYQENDVKYIHGEGCSSTLQSLLQSDKSIVFGHFHAKRELIYNQNKFAMCVGWLGDENAMAFEYAKFFIKKPQLGCGIVANSGKLPILVPFYL